MMPVGEAHECDWGVSRGPPSRACQDWFHMLDEDGCEIIGIRVRCVAEHTMHVSKLGEGIAQARCPRPEC